MADVNLVFPPCENCTNLVQQLHYFDSLTDVGFGGVLGIGIVLIVAGVLFLMGKAFGAEKSAPVAMMISSFIGIMLGILGILNSHVIYICLIFLVVSLFILFKGR